VKAGAALALLGACEPEPKLPPGAPTDGTRHVPTFVSFNLWNDYLPLQVATDEGCRLLLPLVEDDSTTWPPIQVFWVIYDNPRDVVDGTVVRDVFFRGDRVTVDDFPRRGGGTALGFKYLTGLQRSFLPLREVHLPGEGRLLRASFGPPIDAWVRIESEPDEAAEGGCRLSTSYCQACSGQGPWSPLQSIDLELGPLYAVQRVRFVSPAASP
jgi:hypothetical protein